MLLSAEHVEMANVYGVYVPVALFVLYVEFTYSVFAVIGTV